MKKCSENLPKSIDASDIEGIQSSLGFTFCSSFAKCNVKKNPAPFNFSFNFTTLFSRPRSIVQISNYGSKYRKINQCFGYYPICIKTSKLNQICRSTLQNSKRAKRVRSYNIWLISALRGYLRNEYGSAEPRFLCRKHFVVLRKFSNRDNTVNTIILIIKIIFI